MRERTVKRGETEREREGGKRQRKMFIAHAYTSSFRE